MSIEKKLKKREYDVMNFIKNKIIKWVLRNINVNDFRCFAKDKGFDFCDGGYVFLSEITALKITNNCFIGQDPEKIKKEMLNIVNKNYKSVGFPVYDYHRGDVGYVLTMFIEVYEKMERRND